MHDTPPTLAPHQLVFVISPPRAGSTLLQRMLGAHEQVFTHPEPHIVTPLAYLGYHDRVDKAPYDHINSGEAMRDFVGNLPRGEEDYLDALRAYANTLYGRMLATSKATRFVDKTPAYALVLPFLRTLYPTARYIVLTRHPLAVFSSYANSFFDGRWQEAHAYNPILERYIPAMARFLRDPPAHCLQVNYESLVTEPEAQLQSLFEFLDLPPDRGAVDYGKRDRENPPIQGQGDPINVHRHDRPVASSTEKWVGELLEDTEKRELAHAMLAPLDDEDLTTWGTPRDQLWAPMEGLPQNQTLTEDKKPKRVLNRYTMQRIAMLALKKDIHKRPHGEWLRRVRYYCDVLLREQ